MNIYVGNLSYDATDVTIREAFESFGQVTLSESDQRQVQWPVPGVWFCRNACAVSGSNGH